MRSSFRLFLLWTISMTSLSVMSSQQVFARTSTWLVKKDETTLTVQTQLKTLDDPSLACLNEKAYHSLACLNEKAYQLERAEGITTALHLERKNSLATLETESSKELLKTANLQSLLEALGKQYEHQQNLAPDVSFEKWTVCRSDCWYKSLFYFSEIPDFDLSDLTISLPLLNDNTVQFLAKRYFLDSNTSLPNLTITADQFSSAPVAINLILRGEGEVFSLRSDFSLRRETSNQVEFTLFLEKNISSENQHQTDPIKSRVSPITYRLTFADAKATITDQLLKETEDDRLTLTSVKRLQLDQEAEVTIASSLFIKELQVAQTALLILKNPQQITPPCASCATANNLMPLWEITLHDLKSVRFDALASAEDEPTIVLASIKPIAFSKRANLAKFAVSPFAGEDQVDRENDYFWVSKSSKQVYYYGGEWLKVAENTVTFYKPATKLADVATAIILLESLPRAATLVVQEDSDNEVLVRLPGYESLTDAAATRTEPIEEKITALLTAMEEKELFASCSLVDFLFKGMTGADGTSRVSALAGLSPKTSSDGKELHPVIFYFDAPDEDHDLLVTNSSGKIIFNAKQAEIKLEAANKLSLVATASDSLKLTVTETENVEVALQAARKLELAVPTCPETKDCQSIYQLEITEKWKQGDTDQQIAITMDASLDENEDQIFFQDFIFQGYGSASINFKQNQANGTITWHGTYTTSSSSGNISYLPVRISSSGAETVTLEWHFRKLTIENKLFLAVDYAEVQSFNVHLFGFGQLQAGQNLGAMAEFQIGSQGMLSVGEKVQAKVAGAHLVFARGAKLRFAIDTPREVGKLTLANQKDQFILPGLQLDFSESFIANYLAGSEDFTEIVLLEIEGEKTALCLSSSRKCGSAVEPLVYRFQLEEELADGAEPHLLELVGTNKQLRLRKADNEERQLEETLVTAKAFPSLADAFHALVLETQTLTSVSPVISLLNDEVVSRLLVASSVKQFASEPIAGKSDLSLNLGISWFEDFELSGKLVKASFQLFGSQHFIDFGLSISYDYLLTTKGNSSQATELFNFIGHLAFQTPIELTPAIYLGLGTTRTKEKTGWYLFTGAKVNYQKRFSFAVADGELGLSLLPEVILNFAPRFLKSENDFVYNFNQLNLKLVLDSGDLLNSLKLAFTLPLEGGFETLYVPQTSEFQYYYFYGRSGLDLQVSFFDIVEMQAGYRVRYGKNSLQHGVSFSLVVKV